MRSITIFLTLAFLLSACGSSTSMTESWTNKEAIGQGPYDSVFIIAMTGNTVAKALIEDELAFYAQKKGVKAIKAHEVFPVTFSQGDRPDKETIMQLIRDTGADAIFTVTLLDEKTESRYVPGNTNYAYGYRPMSYSYYRNFYGYYRTVYPIAYEPGYYTTDKIFYMESNVYNAKTEQLIWSGQSKTYNPSSLESFTQDYTEALIKKLTKDGLIAKE